jgi:hypothetical protein
MRRQSGTSLAELLVALSLLALTGSLSTRLLVHATRDMETAELGLRAALFLSELWEGSPSGGEVERSVGPGTLIGEGGGKDARVRFEPPGEDSSIPGGSGGFQRARSWTLDLGNLGP